MRKTITLSGFFILLFTNIYSQTFSGNGGAIPDFGGVTAFPVSVPTLTPSTIDTVNFGLESVCINITHPNTLQLVIYLLAPDSTLIDLSLDNGSGADYTNTCFNNTATNHIIHGTAPFTGNFKPQGSLGLANNGQKAKGQWKLLIRDVYPGSSGSLTNWKITFSNKPAKAGGYKTFNLPLVLINTRGNVIVNEPKINATISIITNNAGLPNRPTDVPVYKGHIGIELRGATSQLIYPKKPYGFTTTTPSGEDTAVSILGMPAESDWILNSSYPDKTFLRNVLAYKIFNEQGHYASRTRFCELILNGQYQGIYIIMEKIKWDDNRVDISKLSPTDVLPDSITGGYILKMDKGADIPNNGWTSPYAPSVNSSGQHTDFQYTYPKPTKINTQQKNYIQAYVDSFETALTSGNFKDPVNGYRKYASVNSFIDYMLVTELTKNPDGFRVSTYFHKNKRSKGGKLKMGPVWDFDLAWGNATGCEAHSTNNWQFLYGNICPTDIWQPSFWWGRFAQDNQFVADLRCHWDMQRKTFLSFTSIDKYIDSVANALTNAQARNFAQWPILGKYVWPNPQPVPATFKAEIDSLKDWIHKRFTWMDNSIPGNCTVGLAEKSTRNFEWQVYPNPFSNYIDVVVESITTATLNSIDVMNLLGMTLKSVNVNNQQTLRISLEELPAGIYLLKLNTNEHSDYKMIEKY